MWLYGPMSSVIDRRHRKWYRPSLRGRYDFLCLTWVHITTYWPCNEVHNSYIINSLAAQLWLSRIPFRQKSKGIVHYDVKLICYPLKYSTHLLPIQAIPILIITANIIMTLFTTPSFFKKPTVLNIRSERPISLHGLLWRHLPLDDALH